MSESIEQLIENEEQRIIEDIENYEYLVDFMLEDLSSEDIVNKFIENYKPTVVYSIMFADSNYESDEAIEILKRIGVDELASLILEHLYVKQDHDIYQTHWNDLVSVDWSDYETTITLEDGSEEYHSVDLGRVRYKIDVEALEKQLFQRHSIDVSALCIEEPQQVVEV